MSEQTKQLIDHLAALAEQEATVKLALKQVREEQRRQWIQRQTELGLAPVPRPRANNRFVSSIQGETIRLTAFLTIEAMREVRELAATCQWTISGTLQHLVSLGLGALEQRVVDNKPSGAMTTSGIQRSSMADSSSLVQARPDSTKDMAVSNHDANLSVSALLPQRRKGRYSL